MAIIVTTGLVYMYLARLVGHMGDQGAFRALARGYTHWASGRLEEIQINTNNPACAMQDQAIHESWRVQCIYSSWERGRISLHSHSYMWMCCRVSADPFSLQYLSMHA